jgi:eukaryotic-like serine/threonine-protein kinase
VADFGIALMVADGAATRLTGTGLFVGTPSYMSPEQFMGDLVDGRSDLYALGCVLYEMLAGAPPFAGSAQVLLAKRLTEDAPLVSAAAPGVSPMVALVLARALARNAADRHATAGDFAAALLAESTGEGVAAPGGGQAPGSRHGAHG